MDNKLPSVTAYLVVNGMLNICAKPGFEYLIAEERKQLLRLFREQWRSDCVEWITLNTERLKALESPVTLGIETHYISRKTLIESMARQLIAQGAIGQVVNLSAGFDTLALTLAQEYPEHYFIELDYPTTQCTKKRAIANGSICLPKNLEFNAIDWTSEKLGNALSRCSYNNSQKPTLFIMEGLTMYLSPKEMISLLSEIQSESRDGSYIIVGIFSSLLSKKTVSNTQLEDVYKRLGEVKEAYLFSCASEDAAGFLEDNGFILEKQFMMGDMQVIPLSQKERFAITHQVNAEHYYLAKVDKKRHIKELQQTQNYA